jgi:PKD repeat protein
MLGILLILLCAQPALADIPNAKSYEEYVTLIHDQSAVHGGCEGLSFVHVLEILKEKENPYTPDPSYAFHNYVWVSAALGDTLGISDPRIPNNPGESSQHILETWGSPAETSYPTNFNKYGDTYEEELNRPPGDEVFNEAQYYRISGTVDMYNPSVAQAEEWIATKGPLVCNQLFPGHTVALIGYDRSTSEFTIVDSGHWLGIDHAGVKKVPYSLFTSRKPNISIEAVTNGVTPLVDPYAARIKIHHYYRRSMLTIKIGAVGHDPVTVWDENNKVKYPDLGQDLTIDVPLPSYAAQHWPPSDQNQWYVEIVNHDDVTYADLQEVTLARRYPSAVTQFPPDTYRLENLPVKIPPGSSQIIVPDTDPKTITVTSPNGGEQWIWGEQRTVTWTQTGLSGTNVTIDLRKGSNVIANIAPSIPAQTGSWNWQVPDNLPSDSDYSVRVTSLSYPTIEDCSNGIFTIVTPPLSPGFTATPMTGVHRLSVQFTDTTTPHPTSWEWMFGDGSISYEQNPIHNYGVGTYSVSLTVSYGGEGSKTITKSSLIKVLEPVPDFTATPVTGNHPLTVNFYDTSTGYPIAWLWSFGDGQTSTLKWPSHTYTYPGTFIVSLQVTYQDLGNKYATKPNFIKVLEPVPDFTATPVTGPHPLTVKFTDTSTGVPSAWLWSFGDGQTSTLKNPSHIYTYPGTFMVSLQVTYQDLGNKYATKPNFITVFAPPGSANFTANTTTGFHPLTVQFKDTSTGYPSAWSWSFGDGQTSQIWNPVHTFAAPGTYLVSLTTTYPGGQTAQYSKNIIVVEALKPGFTANAWAGYQPFSVQFTDLTTGGPTSWLWDFGDGGTSTAQHPSHTYTAPGTYAVTLTVANAAAGSQTLRKTGYIVVYQIADGRILVQAEDFGNGGEGVDSHDLTPGNSGGAYRPDQDVDIAAFSIRGGESGFAITDIQTGEWTRYLVWNAGTTERDAACSLRLANGDSSLDVRKVTISVDGLPNTVTVNVPYTGSDTAFVLVNTTVRLRPYMNAIRFAFKGSGYRFDSFLLDPPSSVPTPTPTAQPIKVVPGGSGTPHWLKTEGMFDDVNGNFRLDFADVTLYFNQMTWIGANEPVAAFDYNGNGRIDFADVTWLFQHL